MDERVSARTGKRIDIFTEGDGSIWILHGTSDIGRDWIEEHCDEGNYNPFGFGARLVEHRYIGDIVQGAANDGLRVEVR